jgi:tRNA dimethylallyltransferase
VKSIFLLGPTASGKTAVALALAERFPAEIVSVDSAQVYRGMDVGTAKPDAVARKRVPHHLIDIVEPTARVDLGGEPQRIVAESPRGVGRGRVPIFAGGTMLYYRALTRGLAELPTADAEVRARIEARAALSGWPALHAELLAVDPETAARLAPTDAQRIQRALEVYEVAGEPLSTLHARSGREGPPFEMLAIALEPSERSVLHERIATRFHAMLRAGLVAELEGLRGRHALHAQMPSMRAVGYRQAWDTLEGGAPQSTLAERGIAATRQLAKRQLTWLRSMDSVERFDCLRPDLEAAVAQATEDFL